MIEVWLLVTTVLMTPMYPSRVPAEISKANIAAFPSQSEYIHYRAISFTGMNEGITRLSNKQLTLTLQSVDCERVKFYEPLQP